MTPYTALLQNMQVILDKVVLFVLGFFYSFIITQITFTELQTVSRIQQQLIRHSDNILRAECPVDAVRQSFPQRNQIKLNLFFPHRGPLKCIQYSSQQHTVQ